MEQQSLQSRSVAGVKPDIPCQRREIRHPDKSPECDKENYPQKDCSDHSLFILFQTAQKPTVAPRKTSAAVQNTPLLKVRSSQRPTKTPMRIGATIVHPNRPIIASARPIGHSPVRRQCSLR